MSQTLRAVAFERGTYKFMKPVTETVTAMNIYAGYCTDPYDPPIPEGFELIAFRPPLKGEYLLLREPGMWLDVAVGDFAEGSPRYILKKTLRRWTVTLEEDLTRDGADLKTTELAENQAQYFTVNGTNTKLRITEVIPRTPRDA